MKKYVPLIALALTLSLSTSAFAMEVPTNTVVQNLNGSQQVIKTYTIDPGTDPQELAGLILTESVQREQLQDDCGIQVLCRAPEKSSTAV